MTDEANQLLDLIEEVIVQHGGDLGGWTRRSSDRLQLFDGRVTLSAKIEDGPEQDKVEPIHAHVLATLNDHQKEVLDACMFGMRDSREDSLKEIALFWMTQVAGPIKSFIDDKPVCMTVQSSVPNGNLKNGYSEHDYGIPGFRAAVGPEFSRGMETNFDGTYPWFRYAAESAAPRHVHLVKSIVFHRKDSGWYREMEIDGHDVSHSDPNWPATVGGPAFGYQTRFAIFTLEEETIRSRKELDRTINHFALNYNRYETIDELMECMVREGFDVNLVDQAEAFATIAFGRLYFEGSGVQYSSVVTWARADGRIEDDVPLMSVPAYSRARAIGAKLRESMASDDFQALCFYNAESRAIIQFIEASVKDGVSEPDLSGLRMLPCIVPEHGVSDATMNKAVAALEAKLIAKRVRSNKAWWQFWR